MNNETKFFNQALWNCHDIQITENWANLTSFFTLDKYGISQTNLQFIIMNPVRRFRNSLTLTHKDVLIYLTMLKPVLDNINQIIKEINNDQNTQKDFKLPLKKILRTTFLYRMEYDGICVRFVISNKSSGYLDNEKVYIGLYDFMSLIKILVNYRDSYLSLASAASSTAYMNQVVERLDSISNRFRSFTLELKAFRETKEETSIDTVNIDLDLEKNDNQLLSEDSTSNEEITIENDDSTCGLQSNLESFLDSNIDNINLPDGYGDLLTAEKTISIVSKSEFTNKFLKNDLVNLETCIYNLISSDDFCMFDKFLEHLKTCLELDGNHKEIFMPGCSDQEYWQIIYITSRQAKYHLNRHLVHKHQLPASTLPVYYPANPNDFNIDIMYDLFLYFVFYTQLKNQVQEKDHNTTHNKELICFSIKCLLSPLVFSFMDPNANREVFISEITNRFNRYKENKVFNNVYEQLHNQYGERFEVTEVSIKNLAGKIFDVAITKRNEFTIANCFKNLSIYKTINIPYETFSEYNLTKEQIIKILILESEFQKEYKPIVLDPDHTLIQGLPDGIISILVDKKEVDTSLLERFISKEMENNPYLNNALEIPKVIKSNWRNLDSSKYEFVNFPESVLKAIILWDVHFDRRITLNYKYFKRKIDDSTLTKAMILSMINNSDKKEDSNFMQAFKVSSIDN